MRNSFARQMVNLAGCDKRVVLLTADIGNRLFDNYKQNFPSRFFNCGIAEANMTGMAAGLALSGLRPFIYTIAPFITSRCFEQIKIDICYHNAPVIIVGTGAGLSYAELGATHHSFEDIGILRTLPNINIICPVDAVETEIALKEALKLNTPSYIRLGKKNEPLVFCKGIKEFKIGGAVQLQNGHDLCIISTGNITSMAQEIARVLQENSISTEVYHFHTVKPLDERSLNIICYKHKFIVIMEEHSIIGGLGSAIAEFIIDNNLYVSNIKRFAIKDEFVHQVGTQEFVRNKFGLSVKNISDKIKIGLNHENCRC